jgi:hypothetical protein
MKFLDNFKSFNAKLEMIGFYSKIGFWNIYGHSCIDITLPTHENQVLTISKQCIVIAHPTFALNRENTYREHIWLPKWITSFLKMTLYLNGSFPG